MKYLTKEWYMNCQKTHLGYNLEISEDAETFSEEYYKHLYKNRLDNYKNDYLSWTDHNEEFKLEDADNYAVERCSQELFTLKNRLPSEIAEAIPDIRVAALGRVSADCYDKIKSYCESMKYETENTSNTYWDYYSQIKKNLPKNLKIALNRQHDAHVCKIGYANDDYTIETKYGRNYRFVFKDATVLEDVEKFERLTWLYEEIYMTEGHYEVHVLFHASRFKPHIAIHDIALTQLTIQTKEIEVAYEEPIFRTEYLGKI